MKSFQNYMKGDCSGGSFMYNKYDYTLKANESSSDVSGFFFPSLTLDKAGYYATLKRATMKVNKLSALTQFHISCNQELEAGKTYSLDDIHCEFLGIGLWDRYSHIGQTNLSTVRFSDDQLWFSLESGMPYPKKNNFFGCWEWWGITLLILLIVLVFADVIWLIIWKRHLVSKQEYGF